ncbi:SusC/RagA family TonB-linked outer membrane protein [Gramella jeungdoensis]|uniref:SusC/RagA family TonB-linked outer membrane protein n=1 Tax=Gramella jeungdoensis TaxID=708091 RepID=A0ABT0YWS2_9FLAO|nr:SusC/RagA family TonB-linked outer membrane protein [Gramella jeungdoensis]MCM8567804.1 SusC/RagA family TonB-linked outer membrane protein [Gramella jeungdoensis]
MKTKFSSILTLLLAFVVQISFAQQQTITGTVTDEDGLPLPGVNIVIKGTSTGVQTDFDGNYSIEAEQGEVLVFSFVGLETAEYPVGSSNTIDVVLKADAAQLQEVVVTALGIKRDEKKLTYASQNVKSDELNITQDANIKNAIAGKVAGVQFNGQVGSKLGASGGIRLRGAISLTADSDPLYIVDNVPVDDPNVIDMDNVESLNVLKGPAATALYGQRAEYGAIVITTKGGDATKLGVEITSSLTFDEVARVMDYQNEYGQGYSGEGSWATFDFDGGGVAGAAYPSEWQIFDGARYNTEPYADESWGPRFDGESYVPWYAWFPDSPYFGQTATWEAQPDNVRDFYNTGVTAKNGFNLTGGGENYRGRLSFTNLNQEGIIPASKLNKNFISAKFDIDVTEKLNLGTSINYTTEKIQGEFADGYGNNLSGSFNSWFGRDVSTDKLRELRGLSTPQGYATTWNWWGPDYYAYGVATGARNNGFQMPVFWFNPYFWTDNYQNNNRETNLIGNLNATYNFNDNLNLEVRAARRQTEFRNENFIPFDVEYSSAHDLYVSYVNSFGRTKSSFKEDNYTGILRYNNEYGKFDVDALVGGQIRIENYDRLGASMSSTNFSSGGLIIPDVYTFANSREQVIPDSYLWEKQVNSLYGNLSLGYDDMLFLDGSLRKDYSSSLFPDNNGYLYPSIGTSFIFSELTNNAWLSFGKIRASWAQLGSDVSALALNPVYPLNDYTYNGNALMYNQSRLVDPSIQPALNSSFEVGLDVRFFNNRLRLNATYYNEERKDDIVPVSLSNGTGYSSYLTNAGVTTRDGIELVLNVAPFRSEDFAWDITFNFADNNTIVEELPGDLQSLQAPGGTSAFSFVSMYHQLNGEWGQIRGAGIRRTDDGTPVVTEGGLFVVDQNQFFGSILPDFTGGVLNQIRYKDFRLAASIDFQKGGKFFSLSENWGSYSGLTAETAGLNDRGNPQRDPVEDGGGVHVVGVTTDGAPVDTYVDALTYHGQYYSNRLAEPFIHDASYVKLRDISLSYTFDGDLVNNVFDSATLGVVGRNLWLISVADDNVHSWDPSELPNAYGENGGLPSTRSYGVNLRLNF